MVISLKFQISNFEQIKFSTISTNFPLSCQIRFLKNIWIVFHPFCHWPFPSVKRSASFGRFPQKYNLKRRQNKDNLLQYRCSRSSLFTLLSKSTKHNVHKTLGERLLPLKS